MITYFFDFSNNNNFIGSSFVSPALGRAGQGWLNNEISPLPKNRAKPESKRAKRKGVWGKEFLPACSARRRRAGGGKAFSQFLRQQEGKTEKFSFP